MTERPDSLEEGEYSAIVPIPATSPPPSLLELEAVFDPLPLEVLGRSLEARLDEMLRRLNARDHLATLALAESILLVVSGHGLAVVCRTEALGGLAALLDNPLTTVPAAAGAEQGPLTPDTKQLLARCDGRTKLSAMLPNGVARVRMLRALHDLMRLGLVRGGPPAEGAAVAT